MPLARPGRAAAALARRSSASAQIRALVAYVASLGTGPPIPTPQPERGQRRRRACSSSPTTAPAATRSPREGGYVTGARVPPLDQATPTQIAEAVRIGPYLMPRFSSATIIDRAAQLDRRLRRTTPSTRTTAAAGAIGHLGPVARRAWSRGCSPPSRSSRCACVIGRRLQRVTQLKDWLIAALVLAARHARGAAARRARRAAHRPGRRARPRAPRSSCSLLLVLATRRARRPSSSSTRSTALARPDAVARARARARASRCSRPRCIVDRASGSSSTEELERGLPASRAPERAARRSTQIVERERLAASRASGCDAGRRAARRRRARRSRCSRPRVSLGPGRSTPARCARRRGAAAAGSSTRTAQPLARRRRSRTETFYTAYPGGRRPRADRLAARRRPARPAELDLPPARAAGRREGILAYSKICTHAGCAIALYRKPPFAPTQPRPALVCPCHYSTFDPATGGDGALRPGRPAAAAAAARRSTRERHLRAAGNFSGPVGPSWWGVREREASRVIRARRPLPRRAHRRRAVRCRRRCATSSPTTGRSCSARSRSTRSSCSSRPGVYLTLFFEPSLAHDDVYHGAYGPLDGAR